MIAAEKLVVDDACRSGEGEIGRVVLLWEHPGPVPHPVRLPDTTFAPKTSPQPCQALLGRGTDYSIPLQACASLVSHQHTGELDHRSKTSTSNMTSFLPSHNTYHCQPLLNDHVM